MTTEELKKLEATLWQTADTLRANSDLKSSEYSTPVLGLIFLKFADNKYSLMENEINTEFKKLKATRRERSIEDIAIEKCGFYLPPESRYDYLLKLPGNEDLAVALKKAMQSIEKYKPELTDTLPLDEFFRLNRRKEGNDTIIDNTTIIRLLKNFADIPKNASGDMFGQIYEYFLGKFAMAEGQGGGEFFTPRSVVRLMVQIIEPHNGTVFAKLHELLKEVDKSVRHIEKELSKNKDLKTLKDELEELHQDAKATEYFFGHIAWLQERFPEAQYEDVTGLCKLASLDEVKEQEDSLNPGRYVGVVIEEDGKTEEEFIDEMLSMNAELEQLNAEARKLETVIGKNIRLIAGEE